VFTIASVLSLLLCAATILFWVRSYTAVDCPAVTHWAAIHQTDADDQWSERTAWLSSNHGNLTLAIQSEWTQYFNHYPGATFESQYPGGIAFTWRPNDVETQDWYGYLTAGHPTRWYWLGCSYRNEFSEKKMYVFSAPDHLYHYRSAFLVAPHPSIAALFGVMPVVLLIRHLRRRIKPPLNLCLQCGYDLRASKIRCPECGTAIIPEARVIG
jgi:hypothetical protein